MLYTTDGGSNWYGSDTCSGQPITLHAVTPELRLTRWDIYSYKTRIFSWLIFSLFNRFWNKLVKSKTISNDDLERGTMASDVHPPSSFYGRSYAAWVRFSPPFPINFAFTTMVVQTGLLLHKLIIHSTQCWWYITMDRMEKCMFAGQE